jgi:hypothetical protein
VLKGLVSQGGKGSSGSWMRWWCLLEQASGAGQAELKAGAANFPARRTNTVVAREGRGPLQGLPVEAITCMA